MPGCTVAQPLAGKSAQEIFSTDLLIQEIKNNAKQLQIDISALEEKYLPLYLENCLESADSNVRAAAHSIMKLVPVEASVAALRGKVSWQLRAKSHCATNLLT